MQLWLLKARDRKQVTWDDLESAVVRAETEQDARAIAAREDDDETEWYYSGKARFTDPEQTSCDPLTTDGKPGIVVAHIVYG